MKSCYLLNLDRNSYFSSTKRLSPACNQKVDSRTGEVTSYYLQILGTTIVIVIIKMLFMMLAFLVDQALQQCCTLLNAVWTKVESKRQL